MWRIFSILLRNSACINVHTTRPPLGRYWYCLVAVNTWEEFALFNFAINVSRYINDDNGFLYRKPILWSKNNYETFDGSWKNKELVGLEVHCTKYDRPCYVRRQYGIVWHQGCPYVDHFTLPENTDKSTSFCVNLGAILIGKNESLQ